VSRSGSGELSVDSQNSSRCVISVDRTARQLDKKLKPQEEQAHTHSGQQELPPHRQGRPVGSLSYISRVVSLSRFCPISSLENRSFQDAVVSRLFRSAWSTTTEGEAMCARRCGSSRVGGPTGRRHARAGFHGVVDDDVHVKLSHTPTFTRAQGMQNITAAMDRQAVRRLIVSSTLSARDQNDLPDRTAPSPRCATPQRLYHATLCLTERNPCPKVSGDSRR